MAKRQTTRPDMPFSGRLRQAVEESQLTRYRISQTTGIDQATLCRFVRGEVGLSLANIDELVKCLGLELRKLGE